MTLSWRERIALCLYQWLMQAAVPLLRRKLRRRGQREPLYLADIEQRFGHYQQHGASVPPLRGAIWVHAVSLGEARAAALLLPALRARWPGVPLLLTHGTATGRAEGARCLLPGDVQVWQPWDTAAAVQRFFDHFQPRLGVMMETEVWPQWVQAAQRRGVPVFVVNARLSEKSLRMAQRLPSLMRPAYRGLAGVLAQTAVDAQRLRQVGAKALAIAGTRDAYGFGNLKFDLQPDAALLAQGRRWREAAGARPVVLLASSREGEEQLWLEALRQHSNTGRWAKQILWLLVPRHPQRFDAVFELVRQAGLSCVRRSAWGESAPPPEAAQAQVWLGDSLGEMHAYYALADVAWLGGSFLPLGGQNLIEAAACACPVVMGPHTFNFADAASQSERVGAAQRVPDMQAALDATEHWLQDEDARRLAQQAAVQLWQAGQGAVERYVEVLAQAGGQPLAAAPSLKGG